MAGVIFHFTIPARFLRTGTQKRRAKKQAPLKKTEISLLLDFLSGTASALFIKKNLRNKLAVIHRSLQGIHKPLFSYEGAPNKSSVFPRRKTNPTHGGSADKITTSLRPQRDTFTIAVHMVHLLFSASFLLVFWHIFSICLPKISVNLFSGKIVKSL